MLSSELPGIGVIDEDLFPERVAGFFELHMNRVFLVKVMLFPVAEDAEQVIVVASVDDRTVCGGGSAEMTGIHGSYGLQCGEAFFEPSFFFCAEIFPQPEIYRVRQFLFHGVKLLQIAETQGCS